MPYYDSVNYGGYGGYIGFRVHDVGFRAQGIMTRVQHSTGASDGKEWSMKWQVGYIRSLLGMVTNIITSDSLNSYSIGYLVPTSK